MADDEISELTAKVNKLVDVFEEALDELKEQEPSDNKEVLETLNEIKEQNSAIAEAVVALADMVKELKEEGSPQTTNYKPPTSKGFPSIPPRRTAPKTEEEDLFGPRVTSGLPPIPPKKKGLFR